jgi:hypothetical protein
MVGAMGLDACDKEEGLEGAFSVALERPNWELWGETGGNGAEFGVWANVWGLDIVRGEDVPCTEAFEVLTHRLDTC